MQDHPIDQAEARALVRVCIQHCEDAAHDCYCAHRRGDTAALLALTDRLIQEAVRLRCTASTNLRTTPAGVATCRECGCHYPETNLDNGYCIGCSLKREAWERSA